MRALLAYHQPRAACTGWHLWEGGLEGQQQGMHVQSVVEGFFTRTSAILGAVLSRVRRVLVTRVRITEHMLRCGFQSGTLQWERRGGTYCWKLWGHFCNNGNNGFFARKGVFAPALVVQAASPFPITAITAKMDVESRHVSQGLGERMIRVYRKLQVLNASLGKPGPHLKGIIRDPSTL